MSYSLLFNNRFLIIANTEILSYLKWLDIDNAMAMGITRAPSELHSGLLSSGSFALYHGFPALRTYKILRSILSGSHRQILHKKVNLCRMAMILQIEVMQNEQGI